MVYRGFSESWSTRSFRWLMNCYPAYRGSGGRIMRISGDWHRVRIRLPLSWRTRNYVGTIFGGSMAAAADPIYMIQLIKILGPDYVVWDKEATIRFRKPGVRTLFATFVLSQSFLKNLRDTLDAEGQTEVVLPVRFIDRFGALYATVDKRIYLATKEFYRAKKKH